MKRKKIGLALGSGSARGLAHIGVIKVLEQEGIPIDVVAGTSIGALIGALYAAGLTPSQMEEIATKIDWKTIGHLLFSPVVPGSGLIDGKKIADFIGEMILMEDIEDLKIPYGAVATDLSTGDEVIITKGKVIDAVQASISIPGVFAPYVYNDKVLIDGGIVNPVPVNVVRKLGADIVIAVYLVPNLKKGITFFSLKKGEKKTIEGNRALKHYAIIERINKRVKELLDKGWSISSKILALFKGVNGVRFLSHPEILSIIGQSISIMGHELATTRMKNDKADIVIEPTLSDIALFDFHRAKEAIAEGERATSIVIEEIKKKIRKTSFVYKLTHFLYK